MLHTLAILLLFQCLGEGLVFVCGLPVPGPVVGMMLLFAVLLARPRLHAVVEEHGTALLRHLSLLFVPAGAGVITAASGIGDSWPALVGAVAVSTFLTLAVTAAVLRAFARPEARRSCPAEREEHANA